MEELEDPNLGLINVAPVKIWIHIFQQYLKINQLVVDYNWKKFEEVIFMSKNLTIYTKKQERCQYI